MTNRMFLDFLIVTRDTPVICFKPSLDMIFLAFFLPPALFVLADSFLAGSSSRTRGFTSSCLTSGVLQLRDGIITIRVGTRVILLLPGLGVSDLSQFWHLAR